MTTKIYGSEKDRPEKKKKIISTVDSEVLQIWRQDDKGPLTLLQEIPIDVEQTQPPENRPPVVSAGEGKIVKEGQAVILDGSAKDEDGRIVRAKWSGPIDLIPDPADITNASFVAPTLNPGEDVRGLVFVFEAEDDKGDIERDNVVITVTKDGQNPPPPPPPVGDFPIEAAQLGWLYNADATLATNGIFPTKQRHPTDPIILFSNASGVDSHAIQDGWLQVNTGGGNGRVYEEYYELPAWADGVLGFKNCFSSIFMLKGAENYSQKDGNHGTTGYTWDGKTMLGGFGWSIHETFIKSKVEGKHGVFQGNQLKFDYPGGRKILQNKEYKNFSTMIADQNKNEVILNSWLDFNDGAGWLHIVKDRVWEKDSDWKQLVDTMPTDAMDYNEIKQGPAFVRRRHKWDRANSGGVWVKSMQIGIVK